MPKDSFSVIFARSADSELRAVPFPFRRRLNQRIFKLKTEPWPHDAESLEGELYLLELDGWGLLYVIDEDGLLITILAVVDLRK